MARQSGTQQSSPGWLVIAGGVLGVVGALLTWYDVDFTAAESETLKGNDISVGSGTLVMALVVGAFGIVMLTRAKRGGSKGSAITALVLSCFVLFIGGYNSAAPGDGLAQFGASDFAEELNISESEASDAIEAAIDSGAMDVSAGVGAYIVTLAGLLGLVGGIMGIRVARKSTPATAAAPPPAPQPPPQPPAE